MHCCHQQTADPQKVQPRITVRQLSNSMQSAVKAEMELADSAMRNGLLGDST